MVKTLNHSILNIVLRLAVFVYILLLSSNLVPTVLTIWISSTVMRLVALILIGLSTLVDTPLAVLLTLAYILTEMKNKSDRLPYPKSQVDTYNPSFYNHAPASSASSASASASAFASAPVQNTRPFTTLDDLKTAQSNIVNEKDYNAGMRLTPTAYSIQGLGEEVPGIS